jgi:hypothetical protein
VNRQPSSVLANLCRQSRTSEGLRAKQRRRRGSRGTSERGQRRHALGDIRPIDEIIGVAGYEAGMEGGLDGSPRIRSDEANTRESRLETCLLISVLTWWFPIA